MGVKEKIIYGFSIYINIIFILRICEKCFLINGFDYIFVTELFLLGMFIYWLYSYLLKKTLSKIIFTLTCITASGVYFNLNKEMLIEVFYTNFFNNVIILDKLLYKGQMTYFYLYRPFIIILLPILSALVLWLTYNVVNNCILFINLSIMILLWFSVYNQWVIEYLPKYLFISVCTFLINSCINKINKLKNQGVNLIINKKQIAVIILVISFLFSKMAVGLPQEIKGNSFGEASARFINRFAQKKQSNIGFKEKGKYNLASSGYSGNDKNLGGPISLSYIQIMKVKSDKPYYLRGTVKNKYTGTLWTRDKVEYDKLKDAELFGVNDYENFNISSKRMEIYHDSEFETTSIFSPNLVYKVDSDEKNIYFDKNPTLLSDEIITEPYIVYFNDISDVNENVFQNEIISNGISFESYMNYQLNPRRYGWKEYKYIGDDTLKKQGDEQFLNNGTIAYKYNDYLQVPENISPKIYELVYSITKDSKSSLEKVQSIKKYLTDNYRYSLDVSEIPKGREFVDYFLFVEKKGYCTYFSSAMVVMCRIAGVPARYVEGFKMSKRKDTRNFYIVSNEDAHAWCEVLALPENNMWVIADPSPTPTEERLRVLDEENKDKVEFDQEYRNLQMQRKDRLKFIEDDRDFEGDITVHKKIPLKVKALLIIISIIVIYILTKIFKILRTKKNIMQSKSIIPLYNYYLKRLARVGIIKPDYEGDMEFVNRLNENKLKDVLKPLVDSSYEEFYGENYDNEIDKEKCYEFIEQYIKQKQGKIKYFREKLFIW